MSAAGACKSMLNERGSKTPLRARCEIDGSGRDCRILTLRSEGVFIESFVPAMTGSNVTLRFHLPNGYEVHAPGVVSYHQLKVGFGVDFTGLSSNDREQIGNLIG